MVPSHAHVWIAPKADQRSKLTARSLSAGFVAEVAEERSRLRLAPSWRCPWRPENHGQGASAASAGPAALAAQATRRCLSWRRSGSFRNLHETFLNKLRRSRHGIRVDLDAGKQICISPVVSLRGRATQLYSHAALLQVSDELFVGIAGRYVPIGIVGVIVQRHVAGIRVKDGDDFGIGVPAGSVIPDKDRSGQIPLERQGGDTEHYLHIWVCSAAPSAPATLAQPPILN